MTLFRHYFWPLFHDSFVITFAWFFSYLLRFNLEVPEPFFELSIRLYPVMLFSMLFSLWFVGLYRGVWRFTSFTELARVIKAVLLGTFTGVSIIFLSMRLELVPRSTMVIFMLLVIILLSAPRLYYRWRKEHHSQLPTKHQKKVLIVGAGMAGELLIRDLTRNKQNDYSVVGFVDDDMLKVGHDIHAIPVLGQCHQLVEIVNELFIQLIIICIPSAKAVAMRTIVSYCEATQVPFKTLPKLQDLLGGDAKINQLRKVSIEDLLNRESVNLDWHTISTVLSNKIILISGGGGSIGAELCVQVAKCKPGQLIILENNEYNLFTIGEELKRSFPELKISICLGDVTDINVVKTLFKAYQPEIIFHAAAYKHVPMLQNQIRAACHNNILGTKVIADCAEQYTASTFVLISTDKAVNPSNIMGVTKRIAEMYCQKKNATSATNYIIVRFGNVLGSAGSVVPIFRKQIEEGGPVTVTDPEITRYFMTIPEACQLILQSAILQGAGEIFVLDMGEPVKIIYLAEQMIKLAGKEPNRDIEIVYTGVRDGEKLSEQLFYKNEKLERTPCNKVFITHPEKIIMLLDQHLSDIAKACQYNNENALKSMILDIVPLHEMT